MYYNGRVYKKGKSDLAFKIVKKLFCTRLNGNALRSKTGEILITAEQKVNRWKEYLEELYTSHFNGNILEEENCVEEEDKRDYILQSEIDFAIENLKNKKACGMDEIQHN